MSDAPKGRVLLVDDEISLIRAWARWLTIAGYDVSTAEDGLAAARLIESSPTFDVVVSDIIMPNMTGIDLLRVIRDKDLDLPVILATARPEVESAVKAIELGALRYLVKPVETMVLQVAVDQAIRYRRLAELKRHALQHLQGDGLPGDKLGLETSFEKMLTGLYLVFQPIVSLGEKSIFAYEALMRSREPAIPHPGAMLSAAERLGRLPDLGRTVRRRAAEAFAVMPPRTLLFLNLHPMDLQDPDLFDTRAPIAAHASHLVLEMTERAALDGISELKAKIANLRGYGYRIAVDDLGAGYAGLSSFANLEPEIVKIDMSLVRDIDKEKTKMIIVEGLVEVCRDLKMRVVAEGVETLAEVKCLAEVGCDLLQGYHFARPQVLFATPAGYRLP